MKRNWQVVVAGTLLAGLVLAAPVFAQRAIGQGGWGAGSRYVRMYDPATVTTITGEVSSVDRFTPARGMSSGIHLMLKSAAGTVSVHLGPAWYIDKQDVRVAAGDRVEVTGSRITFNGQPALIATEVKKGNQVLKLRDAQGVPVWSGWRRRTR